MWFEGFNSPFPSKEDSRDEFWKMKGQLGPKFVTQGFRV